MNVMIFGATSSPSSAIFVKNKNADSFGAQYPEAVRAIQEDLYVDDCLTGGKTVDEVKQLRQNITEINQAGGFAVKKWLSNNMEVLASIPADDRAGGVKNFLDKSTVATERVLGLWWDPVEDVITFRANFHKVDSRILQGERPTKRELCSLIMSVFDPIGIIGNFKIKAMMLLQRTWKTGISWDDEIPDSIYDDWKIWVANLKDIVNVSIPRCYGRDISDYDSVELHTFADASEEAYAAVSYLRMQRIGEIKVAFVSSRVRVAPVKKLSIPRLELLAAVLGVRLAHTICSELRLEITKKFFWSDAKTVLLWIRSVSLRHREFEANRVGEILDKSNPIDWRWIPSALNVADEATRLKHKIDLSKDSIWLRGPAFLRNDMSTWPEERKQEVRQEEFECEIMTNTISFLGSFGDVTGVGPSSKKGCGLVAVKRFLNCNKFSSCHRLYRVAGSVVAACSYWKAKWLAKKNGSVNEMESPWTLVKGVTVPKSGKEIKKFLRINIQSSYSGNFVAIGESFLLKQAQGDVFGDEISDLLKHRIGKKSRLWQLSPFICKDGFLRVGGRIDTPSTIPYNVAHPIILPSKHRLTELIITKEHVMNAHQGQETTYNNLRKRFWIIDGRATVRRVCKQCPACVLQRAKPVIPEMGKLPHYRLSTRQHPFTFCGVDFFGPLEVTVGRHHEKRWGVIFTCMVTRAIHLEVAYGLSTDEFLLAFSKFVDMRGRPCHMYSDNGTNFVGAKKELKAAWEALDWSQITCSEKMSPISWHFIPPGSPHMGGAWERMVQSVKKVVSRTLKERYPKDQTLLTILKGAENIINSRPLTYVSGHAKDVPSLSPNDFLRGFSDVGPPIPGSFGVDDRVRKQWLQAQAVLEQFWKRWTNEYLPDLVKRQKWHSKSDPLQVGDLVLLVDEQLPRNVWVKAVVSATYPGKDKQVRVVEVLTRDFKTKKETRYRRSVDKVCPLGLKIET